jgi:hypothetical protein
MSSRLSLDSEGDPSRRTSSPVPSRGLSIARRFLSALQGGLPALGVLTIMALVAVAAYYLYVANRNGALSLSNDLVTAIETRVSTEMYSYLEPSQRLAELIDADVEGQPVFEGKSAAEAFARHALATIPSATGLGYADAEGNFLYVRRNDDGSIDDKLIDRRNGAHRVTWTKRTPGGDVLSTEEVPTDTFDPRQRPWYVDAARARKPVWTNTYLNMTLRRPAISHVIPRFGKDGKLLTVISVDIELDDLCAFLSQLKIGITGKAYIIDRTGRIVAFPSANWMPANAEDVPAPRLDGIGDPVLTRAYDRMRVEGFGRKVLDIGNRRVIISSEPVKMLAGHDWLVLIVVPESDFIGFVTHSSLVVLAISVAIVAIILGLAGLLGWRNVLAGRRVALATARQQALEDRTSAFVDVGRKMTSSEPAGRDTKTVIETAAEACAAKRAAIWRLSDDRKILSCEDYYDRAARDHAAGLTIHRDEVPVLFEALDDGAVIDTIGAGSDKRAVKLAATYLRRLDISSIYIAPIMLGGRPIGMLSVEDPQGGERAAGLPAFCDALAILLALKFGGAAVVPPAGVKPVPLGEEASTGPAPTEAPGPRRAPLEQTLVHTDGWLESLRAGSIPRAAIGIVKLPEWATVAQRPPDGGARTEMDAIVRAIRSVIDRSDLSYAAQFDDEIVIAAYSATEATAGKDVLSVATALLEMREALLRLEGKWQANLDFRFAVDVGVVMKSEFGGAPSKLNLWGGAIEVAKVLVTAAARHTITASEPAYELLANHFLLRPLGTYYLPEAGNMRTFTLVGRL